MTIKFTPKEGRSYSYATPGHYGHGRVIEIYRRVNGLWLVLHDRERNRSITLRPSSLVGLSKR